MSKKLKRIRCLVCNKLVYPLFSPTAPYMIIPFNIANKHGCICSRCVEYMHDMYYIQATESISDNASDTAEVQEIKSVSSKNDDSVDEKSIAFSANRFALEGSLDSHLKLLEKTVFGQTESATMLLYTIYFNQMSNMFNSFNIEGPKHAHICIIGNTGTGKTLLATTACKQFGIPHITFNATSITSAGYIGDKVEDILERLYEAANGNLELAQNGIIIIDEIDKKRAFDNSGSERDVVGKSVQQELLKILEPNTIYIKSIKQNFYTGNLTVIMMGAFVGIDEILEKRLKRKIIGFATPSENEDSDNIKITKDDLIEYGFIPEFIGRIPVILQLNNLSVEIASKIILAEFQKFAPFFLLKDIKFTVDKRLVEKLAVQISNSSTGARDVYSIVYSLIYPALNRIFQTSTGGICRISSDGSIELILNDEESSLTYYRFEDGVESVSQS